MISREQYISLIRYLLSLGVSLLILLPLALVLISANNTLLIQYPTIHLLTLSATIIVIGFLLTLIAPAVKQFMIKNIFPGSYDYEQKLKNLAGELAQNPNIDDRIAYCNNSLSKILGVSSVEFGARAKNSFNVRVQTPDGINNWFSFGPKRNHDPWTKNDLRRLNWFGSSVAVTLNLEKQRQLEKRRLAQIKKKVLLGTQSLKKLNHDLQQREQDLALQFDELAHDLKNPIAITLNTLVEHKKKQQKKTVPTRLTQPVGLAVVKKQKNSDHSKAGRVLDNLCAEAAWMNKSTDHLLDMARAEAGKITLAKEPLKIHRLVQDTAEFLGDFAGDQGCKIEWTDLTTHAIDTLIPGDDKLIHQLLKLLLTWSIRATKKNLTLSLTTDLSERLVFLDIIVRPYKKISYQKQTDLLDQFTRTISHHHDRRYGITGMELSLAKWILKEHGGSLSIPEADQSRVVLRAAFKIITAKSVNQSQKIKGERAPLKTTPPREYAAGA